MIEAGPAVTFDLKPETVHGIGMDAVIGAINQEKESMKVERADELLQGEISFLPGALKEQVDNPRAEWTGGVSVETRINEGEITREDIEHLKSRVNDFYLETTPGSIVRCIDGRTGAKFLAKARAVAESTKQYLADKKEAISEAFWSSPSHSNVVRLRTIPRDSPAFEKLGPQIAGGTLAGGVSYRHASSSEFANFSDARIADDAKTYGEKSSAGPGGFEAGDHQAHPDKPGLGCGAVDGLEAIHDKVNPRNLKTLYGLTKGILGDEFRENHFTHFISSANSLAANEQYFASKQEAIYYLTTTNPDSLPELMGEHGEGVIVINRVKNTTLHRDYLNEVMREETGKDLQVFGYDLWYSEEMAKKLYPESIDMQERYVHCRVAKAVAALMYLTDGSLEVGVRMPVAG
jgi:hypothetical protein